MVRYKPAGATPAQKGQYCQKRQPLKISVFNSSKGGQRKNDGCRSYGSQYGDFHLSSLVLLFPTMTPLAFSQPIPHGADRLHTAPPRLCLRPPYPPGLAIRTLNIRYGRGFGLAQAIWAVERGGLDVMLLTKTKIYTPSYFRNWLGCDMTFPAVRPTSNRGYQGGVGLVTRDRTIGWGVESTRYRRPNVVISEIFNELPQTLLVGAYLPA